MERRSDRNQYRDRRQYRDREGAANGKRSRVTTEDSDSLLLEVRDLRTHFVTDAGTIPAVDGVSWSVRRGRTVALVGESGCGKSVTALSVLRLLPDPPGRIVGGSVLLQADAARPPIDLVTASQCTMRSIRGRRIAMVFQEPMTSLNPVFSVGEQIAEAITLHRGFGRRAARELAGDILGRVGIPDPARRVRDYPHQLSGGMQQRVMIAMALACEPALLIADEPTTALDVSVQAQILDLLQQLQSDTGMSIVIITHDLAVVARMADDVYVMYAGRIVERAPVRELFAHPLHPYTRGLLRCIPRVAGRGERLRMIPGTVANPTCPPAGCRFHPRCEVSANAASAGRRETTDVRHDGQTVTVLRRCVEPTGTEPGGEPALRELRPRHDVACWEADPTA